MAVKKQITSKLQVKKAIKAKASKRVASKKPVIKAVPKKKSIVKREKVSVKIVAPLKARRKVVNVGEKQKVKTVPASKKVVLPDNMSQRAVEKSLVLGREYKVHLRESMRKIAFVAGICFILIGSSLASSQFVDNSSSMALTAELSSTTDYVTDGQTVEVIPNPVFNFIKTIPDTVSLPAEVKFEVTNVIQVTASLYKIETSEYFPIQVGNFIDSKYVSSIDPFDYSSGTYIYKVHVESANNSGPRTFESQYFTILEPAPAVEDPTFSFMTVVPDIIQSPTEIRFQVTDADQVTAKLYRVETDEYISISVHNSPQNEYGSIVNPDYHSPGTYIFKVQVKPANGKQLMVFESRRFSLPAPEPTPEPEPAPAVEDPTFSFMTVVPDIIQSPTEIRFQVTDADQVTAKLYRVETDEYISISVHNSPQNEYGSIVNPDYHSPGTYIFKVQVKPANGKQLMVFESDSFNFPTQEPTQEPAQEPESEPAPEVDDSSSDDDDDDDDIVEESVSDGSNESGKEEFEFSIASPNGEILSNGATLSVKTNGSLGFVELYARPANSLDKQFVTLAIEKNALWVFMFDTKNIPNGKYDFFARSKKSGDLVSTDSLTLYIKNEALSDSLLDTEIVPITQDSGDSLDREVLSIDDADTSLAADVQPDVTEVTDKILDESISEINVLLVNYAAAKQSGDEVLIEAAHEALSDFKDSLVVNTLEDENVNELSIGIENEIERRISDLEEKIEIFETIRRDKSDALTSVDTDRDGISDLDELNLYKTDPTVSDTDNDGVTDGIEIVRGYDPLDDRIEAVIEFESPKESVGLVRQDVMVVEEVIPVLVVSGVDNVLSVKAEIRGRGLPNSFVTLYIYSSPTIVTVKTDVDGAFVYTFDKELEDGQHDVYVAVTDNAGEIVAQSNPFTFVKRAEAFTPVDAADDSVISARTTVESPISSYNTVVGIGILALGLILLMLGITLRSDKKDDSDPDSGNFSDNKLTYIGNNS